MGRCITYKCALANTEHELDSPGCTATKNLCEEAHGEVNVLRGLLFERGKALKVVYKAHRIAIEREFKALHRLDRALAWAWKYRRIARTNPVNYYTQLEIDHAIEVGDLQSKLFKLWESHDKNRALLEKVLYEVDQRLGVEAGDPLVEEIRSSLKGP
jgi:hypothetical protein